MTHTQVIRALMVSFRKSQLPLPKKIVLTDKSYRELLKELDLSATVVTGLKLYGIEIEKGNV